MVRVIVDQDIAPIQAVRDGLPAEWDVTVGVPGDPAGLVEALAGVDILVTTSRVTVTREVLANIDLEIIGKLGTGTDNIDLAAARELGVPVTYTPGYNALSVAEHALGLMLATARRHPEGRRLIESGRWRDEMPLGTRISGRPIGIVGLGNVGKRLAKLLHGFEAEVRFYDPYIPTIDGELVNAISSSFEELLAESGCVFLTPELTDETVGMIDEDALERMPDDVILVNTSRGPVLDEDALVSALETGTIGAVGLDVFAEEPLGPDSPLLAFDNVVVTPHVGGMTAADREKTISHLTRHLRAWRSGETIPDRFLARP